MRRLATRRHNGRQAGPGALAWLLLASLALRAFSPVAGQEPAPAPAASPEDHPFAEPPPAEQANSTSSDSSEPPALEPPAAAPEPPASESAAAPEGNSTSGGSTESAKASPPTPSLSFSEAIAQDAKSHKNLSWIAAVVVVVVVAAAVTWCCCAWNRRKRAQAARFTTLRDQEMAFKTSDFDY